MSTFHQECAVVKSRDDSLLSTAGIIVAMISFLVYLLTTSPTVYVGDSGEFIASAYCLGISHNSGYPLYGLVGKIFSMIPIGNVAFRLNLMSACFGAATVWLIYAIIIKTTRSHVAAFSSGLLLAFSPALWSQTACAEVYTLHAFFVALITLLLLLWDENKSLQRLLILAFVVSVSFANHMQTVMLAPAVFTFIIWSERKALFAFRNLFLLAFFFLLGLSIYIYLPIRTEAGAAIHWGDPDTLERLFNHVAAVDHRHAYALNKSWTVYLTRWLSALREMFKQYHLFLLFAVIGWWRQKELKWKVFWLLVIFFDTIYTVFLNIVSLEITPFQIPSSVILAILIGHGMACLLKYQFAWLLSKPFWVRFLKLAFVCFPIVQLSLHFYQNNQRANYTAYEHGINILRSAPIGATLLIGEDNNLFPVTYLKLVENARTDLTVYDRHNLIFKMPFLYKSGPTFYGKWEQLKNIVEKELVKTREHVYIATFSKKACSSEGFGLIPNGMTYRALPEDRFDSAVREKISPWPYYAGASVNDSFYRDYLNRSVTGYFFLKMGRDLILMGKELYGKELLNKAAFIAYNDESIYLDLVNLYVDMGMYEDALANIEIFSRLTTNIVLLQNLWGCYYAKTGQIIEAIKAFEKSIEAGSQDYETYNNTGLMYLEIGKLDNAREAFKRSLLLKPRQPALVNLIKTKGL